VPIDKRHHYSRLVEKIGVTTVAAWGKLGCGVSHRIPQHSFDVVPRPVGASDDFEREPDNSNRGQQ
jgi:hypothetical protein